MDSEKNTESQEVTPPFPENAASGALSAVRKLTELKSGLYGKYLEIVNLLEAKSAEIVDDNTSKVTKACAIIFRMLIADAQTTNKMLEASISHSLTVTDAFNGLGNVVWEVNKDLQALEGKQGPEFESKINALLPYLPTLSELVEAIQRKVEQMKQEEETTREFINNIGKKTDGTQ